MIGVFDSGIGGLIVAAAIQKSFPKEPFIYLGDTARVPYGNKSKESIIKYSTQGVDFLVTQGADIVIIGCNTSSAVSLSSLRKTFSVPILGVIEPAVTAALEASKNNRIGIIGTRATIGSHIYEKKLKAQNSKVKVFEIATPLLVPFIEEGWGDSKEALSVLETYLAPLKKQRIDTLILGCTHYPALEDQISEVMGRDVSLISSAAAIAEPLKKLLKADTLRLQERHQNQSRLFVTDRTPFAVAIAHKWLGRNARLELTHL